jgi:hypothetical protein
MIYICGVINNTSSSSTSPKQIPTKTNTTAIHTLHQTKIIKIIYEQPTKKPAFQKAMTLPGSRPDIVRTANVPGPSPVGGSKGGTEGRSVQNLDEFEYQAAHYNVACAHACLGNVGDAVNNLQKAFEYGFDNFATVRADPDLGNLEGTREFDALMKKWDPKSRGIMGLFGK